MIRRSKLDQIYDILFQLTVPLKHTHLMCRTFINATDLRTLTDTLQQRGLIVMNQDKNWELTESGVEALALMDQLNKKIGYPSRQT